MTSKNIKPVSDLFYLLFITAISLLMFYIISIGISMAIFKVSFNSVITSAINPDANDVNILKLLQSIQSTGIFIFPPIVFSFLVKKGGFEYLLVNRKIDYKIAILTIALVFAFIPLVNLLVELNNLMKLPESLSGLEDWMKRHEEINKGITMLFLKTDGIKTTLINLIVLAILPAIGEELMFRGALQPIFAKLTRNIHWGIVISAIIFSAIHFQFYGFIPRFLLGVCFGYLVVWTGSIWSSILAHFINNGFQVIYFSIFEYSESSDIETLGSSQNLMILSFVSIALTFLILYSIKKLGSAANKTIMK
jgi:membrane protease YdiL (CAAX protease family)